MYSASFIAEPYFIRLPMFLWLSCRRLSSTASIPGTSPRNVWPSILISNSISPRISIYHYTPTFCTPLWFKSGKGAFTQTLMTIYLQYSAMLRMKSTMIAVAIGKNGSIAGHVLQDNQQQRLLVLSQEASKQLASSVVTVVTFFFWLVQDTGCIYLTISYHCSTKTISACWPA